METETKEPIATSENLDDVETRCAKPGITPVKVHYGPKLKVTPETAPVKQGRALRFLLPKQSTDLCTVLSRDEGCSWLTGSGTSTFDVCVPIDAQLGLCKYEVAVNGDVLDPYAKIIPK